MLVLTVYYEPCHIFKIRILAPLLDHFSLESLVGKFYIDVGVHAEDSAGLVLNDCLKDLNFELSIDSFHFANRFSGIARGSAAAHFISFIIAD